MGIDANELAKRYPTKTVDWYHTRWLAGKDPCQQQESFATPRKGSRTPAAVRGERKTALGVLKLVPPGESPPWPAMTQLSLF